MAESRLRTRASPVPGMRTCFMRIASSIGLLLAVSLCPLFRAEAQDVLVEWPIEENGRAPVVPVQINNREIRLHIHTGVSQSTVSAQHEFAFSGPSRTVNEEPGKTNAERVFYKVDSLSAGRWRCSNTDIERLSHPGFVKLWQLSEVDGVLGSLALEDVCLQLDYDNKACRLLSKYTPTVEDTPFRLNFTRGVPTIHSRIGEYDDVIIDSGEIDGFCWPGNMYAQLLEERDFVGWRNQAVKLPQMSRECILLRSLTIGDSHLRLENVLGQPAPFASFGLPVLSQFRVTIDYRNKVLYLAPRKSPPRMQAPDASGISLMKSPKGYFALFVHEGTPASEAGMECKDRIVSVEGQPATDFTIHELEGLFTQGGKAVTLGLERNGTRFERRLALRFPIEYPPKWP
jgi:hypothetical protein